MAEHVNPMSKAFTSENDAPQQPLGTLPKNRRPITATGMAKLQHDLRQLLDVTRPALLAAAADDDAEARNRLQDVEWRIETLARQMDKRDRHQCR